MHHKRGHVIVNAAGNAAQRVFQPIATRAGATSSARTVRINETSGPRPRKSKNFTPSSDPHWSSNRPSLGYPWVIISPEGTARRTSKPRALTVEESGVCMGVKVRGRPQPQYY